tara:strand:- start:53 stop:556 length:504 start_codon:yes stop_codon:yes gene_type:complete
MFLIGNLKNSNIYHFLDNQNNNICKNTRMTHIIDCDELDENNKFKMCKLCSNRLITKIKLFNLDLYKLNNYLYENIDDICKNKIYGIIDLNNSGNIYIKKYNYNINLVKINNITYFLVEKDLYSIDNTDILYNIFNNNLGKLLGPKMAKISKELVIINKLKFNLWNF